MIVYVLANLVLYLCTLHGRNITICTVMVNRGTLPYEYRKSGHAVDIAIENIKSMYSEVFNVNYIYRDAGLKCSENGFGAIAAEVYYNDNIDVFIGPGL